MFGELMGSAGIIVAYILIGIAALGALLGSIIGMLRNPGGIKQMLIGLGGLIVVVGIAYMLANDVIPKTTLSPEDLAEITPATAKNVGTGLIAFYILFFVAIAAAVYSEVSRIFK